MASQPKKRKIHEPTSTTIANNKSCTICLENYNHSLNKPTTLDNCGHTFCSNCLDKHNKHFNSTTLSRKKHFRCWLCRTNYTKVHLNFLALEFINETNFDTEYNLLNNKTINLINNLKLCVAKVLTFKKKTKNLDPAANKNLEDLTNEITDLEIKVEKLNVDITNLDNEVQSSKYGIV